MPCAAVTTCAGGVHVEVSSAAGPHYGNRKGAAKKSAVQQPSLLRRSRRALRQYFLLSTGLGSITLGFAIVVSFLAVSYTTEARAPGSEDQVAIVPPETVARVTPTITRDYGPASMFLETPLVLRIIEAPAQESAVPDILANAPAESAPPPPQAPLGFPMVAQSGSIANVNITFYDCANQGFCAHMYNGEMVYEGAAACSWNLPLGTAFYIEGDPTERIYVCKDRGLLDDTWVDIFWYHPSDGYNWQSSVGRYGTIHIVYLP